MVVGPTRHEVEAVLEKRPGEFAGIVDHGPRIVAEGRLGCLVQGDGDGGGGVVVRTAAGPGRQPLSSAVACSSSHSSMGTARAAEGLWVVVDITGAWPTGGGHGRR